MKSGLADAAMQVVLEIERASMLSLIEDAVRVFAKRFKG